MRPGRTGLLRPGLLRPGLLLLALLLVEAPAGATRDPRDYRESLHAEVAALAEADNAAGRFADAIARCKVHGKAFGPSAAVLYEWAYAHNGLGELEQARQKYGEVLELDPRHAAARYDRAELLLAAGDIDGAAVDLAVAAELRPDHWAVHFRLAEVAARRGQSEAFETALMAALKNGLDLRGLGPDPDWQGFARDPVIGPVLERIITVYGDPATLRELHQAPPAP